MRHIGHSQKNRDRSNIAKGIGVIILSIGIVYYGLLWHKCYIHMENLLNDRISTIGFYNK